jgi:hypothetical protein
LAATKRRGSHRERALYGIKLGAETLDLALSVDTPDWHGTSIFIFLVAKVAARASANVYFTAIFCMAWQNLPRKNEQRLLDSDIMYSNVHKIVNDHASDRAPSLGPSMDVTRTNYVYIVLIGCALSVALCRAPSIAWLAPPPPPPPLRYLHPPQAPFAGET